MKFQPLRNSAALSTNRLQSIAGQLSLLLLSLLSLLLMSFGNNKMSSRNCWRASANNPWIMLRNVSMLNDT
jgi:hypothetical protein